MCLKTRHIQSVPSFQWKKNKLTTFLKLMWLLYQLKISIFCLPKWVNIEHKDDSNRNRLTLHIMTNNKKASASPFHNSDCNSHGINLVRVVFFEVCLLWFKRNWNSSRSTFMRSKYCSKRWKAILLPFVSNEERVLRWEIPSTSCRWETWRCSQPWRGCTPRKKVL